jgi:hypothetical protein
MASDSSSITPIPSSFSIPIAEKLTKTNQWHAQILHAIRAAHLEALLTGADKSPAQTITVKIGDTASNAPNPDYDRWVPCD